MSLKLKSLMLCSCFSAVFLVSADFNKLEASHGRWGAYDNERGAWGGNAGWWDGNTDWYGNSGMPDQDNYGGYPSYGYSEPYSSGGYGPNAYSYDNNYPYYGQYYNEPGIGAGAGVDGAGLYFNVR